MQPSVRESGFVPGSEFCSPIYTPSQSSPWKWICTQLTHRPEETPKNQCTQMPYLGGSRACTPQKKAHAHDSRMSRGVEVMQGPDSDRLRSAPANQLASSNTRQQVGRRFAERGSGHACPAAPCSACWKGGWTIPRSLGDSGEMAL